MNKFFKNKKNIIYLSIVTVLLIILMMALFLLFKKSSIKVIDLSELKKDEILTWIKQNNLEDKVEVKYEFSNVIAENELISQSIEAGGVIKNDFLIIISKGLNPDEVINIPNNFSTMNKQQLDEFFHKNKMSNIEYKYTYHETIVKDKIISITPSVKVSRKQKITVVISNGKEDPNSKEIVIPDFKSYTKRNIELWAEKNKINLTFEEVASSTIEVGKFVSQNPIKLTKVKQGSRLIIKISAGKQITIPNLLNRNRKDIEAIAKRTGFKVRIDESEFSDNTEKGLSFDQDVVAGSSIKASTVVNVKISKGKRIKLNFDKNLSVKELKKRLIDKKLRVKEIKEYHNEILIDNLIRTNPDISNNSFVDPNKEIEFYISKGSSLIALNKEYELIAKLKEDLKTKLEKENLTFKANKTLEYNKTIEKEKIIRHDSNYDLINGINYVESLGRYKDSEEGNVNNFNNKNENEINQLINQANQLKANVLFRKTDNLNDAIGCRWLEEQDKDILECNFHSYFIPSAEEILEHCAKNSSESCKMKVGSFDLTIIINENFEKTENTNPRRNPDAKTKIVENMEVNITKIKNTHFYRLMEVELYVDGKVEKVDANEDDYSKRLAAFNNTKNKIKEYYDKYFDTINVIPTIDTAIPAGSIMNGHNGNTPNGEYKYDTPINIYVSIGKSQE